MKALKKTMFLSWILIAGDKVHSQVGLCSLETVSIILTNKKSQQTVKATNLQNLTPIAFNLYPFRVRDIWTQSKGYMRVNPVRETRVFLMIWVMWILDIMIRALMSSSTPNLNSSSTVSSSNSITTWVLETSSMEVVECCQKTDLTAKVAQFVNNPNVLALKKEARYSDLDLPRDIEVASQIRYPVWITLPVLSINMWEESIIRCLLTICHQEAWTVSITPVAQEWFQRSKWASLKKEH